jgi:hypothetical protein
LRLPIAAFIFATYSNEWLGRAGKTIAGIPKARELNGTQIVRVASGKWLEFGVARSPVT